MKPLLYAMTVAGLMASGVALAQTSAGTQTSPGMTGPGTTAGSTTTAGPGSSAGAGTASTGTANSGTTVGSTARSATNSAGNAGSHASNAAAINGNPAVATTSASDPQPAKGSNSFTVGEAKARLERNGFSNVGNLTKDNDGVWRGQAQKGGSTTTVWLDYKGNIGTSH